MNKYFLITSMALLFVSCSPDQSRIESNKAYSDRSSIFVSSSGSRKPADIATQTSDGMQWNTFESQNIGLAIDYPEKIWDRSSNTEQAVEAKEIDLTQEKPTGYLEMEIGSIAPYLNKVIELHGNGSFVIFANSLSPDTDFSEFIKNRYGPTCRVTMTTAKDTVSIHVALGEGEDISNMKCMFPNLAYSIFYSKSHQKMVSLFMGQEYLFPSKTAVSPSEGSNYDMIIEGSLRFVP